MFLSRPGFKIFALTLSRVKTGSFFIESNVLYGLFLFSSTSQSLTMLTLSLNVLIEWYNINEEMLVDLVNDGGIWLKNSLEKIV